MKKELINENSLVRLAPDEADLKKLEKICKKLHKTEGEVLRAAFRVGLPMVEFLGNKTSSKT